MAEGIEGTTVPLWGLVLAGGSSRRMGVDKGNLDFHGQPQATWTWSQLDSLCERAFVAVNDEQRDAEPYARLPLVVDEFPPSGPVTGLLSAWSVYPRVAWLVVAVDMPFLDKATLNALIDARRSDAVATVYRHGDGQLEPLCAIWEPAARTIVTARLAAGDSSLRRCLEASDTLAVTPETPLALRNINSPAAYEEARSKLSEA